MDTQETCIYITSWVAYLLLAVMIITLIGAIILTGAMTRDLDRTTQVDVMKRYLRERCQQDPKCENLIYLRGETEC